MYNLTAGRGALQHRRPDLHWLGRGVSRQRRDERRLPADGAGARPRGDDRRRRMQLRVHLFRQAERKGRQPRRRQCGGAQRAGGDRGDGTLLYFPRSAACAVRCDGGESALCAGLFRVDRGGHSDLCLRAGCQSDHPRRRQPQICDGLYAGRCGHECHRRSDRHFRLPRRWTQCWTTACGAAA